MQALTNGDIHVRTGGNNINYISQLSPYDKELFTPFVLYLYLFVFLYLFLWYWRWNPRVCTCKTVFCYGATPSALFALFILRQIPTKLSRLAMNLLNISGRP